MGLAWDLADIAQCILAFINIPVCVIVGGYAYKALKDYKAQRREDRNPEFKAKSIGIQEPTDFWN
jgi:AGCS family alanine or glycine:cation symporter